MLSPGDSDDDTEEDRRLPLGLLQISASVKTRVRACDMATWTDIIPEVSRSARIIGRHFTSLPKRARAG